MSTQNFSNHSRFNPPYHFVFVPCCLGLMIASACEISKTEGHPQSLAIMMLVLIFLVFLAGFFARAYALKAQDRGIRAEEKLRYFQLSGKVLPASLTVPQIVALRFAADNEFVALATEAAAKQLPAKDIKKAIKNWRADDYRI